MGVKVNVGVGVSVAVAVWVGVGVAVRVAVGVAVSEGVRVGVNDGVRVAVCVEVGCGVAVGSGDMAEQAEASPTLKTISTTLSTFCMVFRAVVMVIAMLRLFMRRPGDDCRLGVAVLLHGVNDTL